MIDAEIAAVPFDRIPEPLIRPWYLFVADTLTGRTDPCSLSSVIRPGGDLKPNRVKETPVPRRDTTLAR
ncbi:hypothetical protein [Saccharopolyspora gloriosae]|uniref:hypothetical protein n=1 Tax=Saccharopolyspora gloriosae TaxID=455344 RepID=UPI001FB7E287|nr:hypothetical protein [Saccharopolyspora gloriosae]